jgi:hypothetical protein
MKRRTAFGDYCTNLDIDEPERRLIRQVLRNNGFRSPYNPNDKRIVTIVAAMKHALQVAKQQGLMPMR